MKFVKYAVVTLMSAVMLFSTHQYISFLIASHGWKGMSPGDWGVWVGAIGTVGALIGTIWLATEQQRSHKQQQWNRALMAAGKFIMPTAVLIAQINEAIKILGTDTPKDTPLPTLLEIKKSFAVRQEWHVDEIERLMPIPNSCAMNFSSGFGRLDAVIAHITALEGRQYYVTHADFRFVQIRVLLLGLRDARDRMQNALNEMEAQLKIAFPDTHKIK